MGSYDGCLAESADFDFWNIFFKMEGFAVEDGDDGGSILGLHLLM